VNILQQQLDYWKAARPDHPALEGHHQNGDPVAIAYGEIEHWCSTVTQLWRPTARIVALMCDNTPDTTLLDLALMAEQRSIVPIPPFFTAKQIQHLLSQASVDTVITDQPKRLTALLAEIGIATLAEQQCDGCCGSLHAYRIPAGASKGVHFDKITFTSGSTGNPKGVCLSNTALLQVAGSLQQATSANAEDRHLALLPYATLLENIGGILVPLLAGATVVQPGLARVGLTGSSGLDTACMVASLHHYRASSCILVPQMLLALVAQLSADPSARLDHLRFAAVGGAPVSPALLTRAEALNIAVFEGYGLSEAASVVAVNTPSARKIGSVGKPLPHLQLRTDRAGELWIKGALMEGYLDPDGAASLQHDDNGFWATGDLGRLDDDGFLHLEGRKKQIFITAFGRNVAPEWVERELTIEPAIAQAVVFGEGKPFNVAVVVARNSQGVTAAIDRANLRLPDYAQVQQFVLANAPFSTANGQAAASGAPQRGRIANDYQQAIAACYSEEIV